MSILRTGGFVEKVHDDPAIYQLFDEDGGLIGSCAEYNVHGMASILRLRLPPVPANNLSVGDAFDEFIGGEGQ